MTQYPFPVKTIESQKRWCLKRASDITCNDMRRLYDTVNEALKEGIFYTSDMEQYVTHKLGTYFDYPNDPGIGKVEFGNRGMEIYYARKLVEKERRILRNLAVLPQFAVGQVLKNIRLGVDKFSTGVVEEIHPEAGEITLSLKKRGSRNRWRATVNATSLPLPAESHNLENETSGSLL